MKKISLIIWLGFIAVLLIVILPTKDLDYTPLSEEVKEEIREQADAITTATEDDGSWMEEATDELTKGTTDESTDEEIEIYFDSFIIIRNLWM